MNSKAKTLGLLVFFGVLVGGAARWWQDDRTAWESDPEESPEVMAGARSEEDAPRRGAIAPIPTRQPNEAELLLNEVGTPWTPDYSDLLERGQGQVELLVRDADGNMLQPLGWHANQPPRGRATAHHGEFRIGERLIEQEPGTWVGGVFPEPGLEPGMYDFEVSAGSYGKAGISEVISRQSRLVAELRLPGRPRTVWLRFEDESGRPIPYLSQPPRFVPLATKRFEDRTPGELLRSRPSRDRSFQVSFSDYSVSGGWEQPILKWPTDNGRCAVQVICGVGGTIAISDMGSFFESSDISLSDPFTGPEWEEHTIVLRPRPDYDRLLAAAVPWEDPSVRASARKSPLPEDEDATLGRVTFPPPAWAAMSASWVIFDPTDGMSFRGPLRLKPNGEWQAHIELQQPRTLIATASDGGFFEVMTSASVAPGEASVGSFAAAYRSTILDLVCPPTLAALGHRVTFRLGTQAQPSRSLGATRHGPIHRLSTGLTEDSLPLLEQHTPLICGLGSNPRQGLGQEENAPTLQVRFDLSPKDRAALKDGAATVDLAESLARQGAAPVLAFRCVGDREEGLPWVEGSVVPAEDDALGKELRDVSLQLGDARFTPRVHEQLLSDGKADAPPEEEEVGSLEVANGLASPMPSDTDRDELSRILGRLPVIRLADSAGAPLGVKSAAENAPPIRLSLAAYGSGPPAPTDSIGPRPSNETFEKVLSPEAVQAYGATGLERLWTNGAWYDTQRRLKSDGRGYVSHQKLDLTPGHPYVLYLWSKSRDDLAPDARIVFVATPGVTDLGVIRLPSH